MKLILAAVATFSLLCASAGRAEEKHAVPSVPENWRFRLPEGEVEAGKEAFRRMQCYACHRVPGADFPEARTSGGVGPDLVAAYGSLSREFLAESIVDNHRYIAGQLEKYVGLDKVSSKMGDYSSLMSVRELIDITEFLASLSAPAVRPSSE